MEKQSKTKEQLLRELNALQKRISDLEHSSPASEGAEPEAKFLLDMISEGFFSIDNQSRFTYVNRAAREILERGGIDTKDLIGKSFSHIFPGGMGSSFYENHQKAIMTGEVVKFEEFSSSLNAWLAVQCYPTLEEITISFRDITAEKQTAEALCESEIRFRALAESATDAIMVIDEHSTMLFVNHAAEKMFGYSSEELLGQSLTMLMPEHLRGKHLTSLQQYLVTGLKHSKWERIEVPGLHKSGKLIPLEMSYGESLMGGKTVFGGILRDITERKEAEDALRKSEITFKMLFFNNPCAMWIYDMEALQFLEVNEAACRKYGYSRDEFLKLKVRDVQPSEDLPNFMEELKARHSRLVFSGERRHILKNGVVIDVEIETHKLDFGGKKGVLVVSKDVTKRKENEKVLRENEATYRLLFESNPEPMYIADAETYRILTVNNAMIKRYGYSREEFLSMTLWDIRPPEEIPKLKERMEQVSQYVEYAGLWKHRKKDGSIIWADIVIEVVHLGNKKAYLVIARVPSKTVEALLESETKYRLFFEANPEAMYIHDLDSYRFLAVNNAAIKRYGYSREEFLSMTILDIRPPEEIQRFKEYVRHLDRTVGGAGLWKHRKKDGTIIWSEVIFESIRIGNTKAHLVIARNLSPKESLLLENEAKYRLLFEANPEPMFLIDFETQKFLAANDAAIKRYGYSREEFLSMTILDVRPSEEVPKLKERMQHFSEPIEASGIWKHRRKDGTIILADVVAEIVQLGDKKAILAIARDPSRKAQEATAP